MNYHDHCVCVGCTPLELWPESPQLSQSLGIHWCMCSLPPNGVIMRGGVVVLSTSPSIVMMWGHLGAIFCTGVVNYSSFVSSVVCTWLQAAAFYPPTVGVDTRLATLHPCSLEPVSATLGTIRSAVFANSVLRPFTQLVLGTGQTTAWLYSCVFHMHDCIVASDINCLCFSAGQTLQEQPWSTGHDQPGAGLPERWHHWVREATPYKQVMW